jgi:DNA-binding transcriptional LysR family regulator
MELRQLRYFVAVAEELHFSRAALRLNLAQSALSSQIRQLEREIGGPLLTRSTRRVALTPAGESLLRDGQEILAATEGALERSRALARGETGALIIGSMGPAPGGLLAPLLARFGSRHPQLRVEVRAFDFTDILDGLRQHHVDLAFQYLPLDEPDLELMPLISEPRVVVLPRDHRLARRKRLRPADLRDETFIMQPEEVPQIWRDHWLLVDELGARPRVSPRMPDKLEEWLTLIGRGEGIDTAPAIIARYYAWPDVAFVPLIDAAPATLALTWRRDDDNELVRQFVALALEVAASASASDSDAPYHGPAAVA